MQFPMYTVAAELLLKMTKVEPHEKLKARGELVIFSSSIGKAAFVSHQWLSDFHPDPGFKQIRILQDAVQRLLVGRGSLPLDAATESVVPTAKPLLLQDFQKEDLFLWYDYFSCPQLEGKNSFALAGKNSFAEEGGSQQASAISSIPAYIARCQFFLALCPTLACPEEEKVLSMTTWGRRGWCRIERVARELSKDNSWVLVRGGTTMEVAGTSISFVSGSVGEGEFAFSEDRQALAPVMRNIVLQKLKRCLQAGDLPGFRRHFNLQTVHLRGLEVEPVGGFLPRHDADRAPGNSALAEFLHQNGFRRFDEVDSAGWRPLHYAALSGDTELLGALLEEGADVNSRTSKDEPSLGFPPWMSALDMVVYFKHQKATKLLLAARAQLDGGLIAAMHFAGPRDNAEGIRLLCAAGGRPLAQGAIGYTPLQTVASYGAIQAVEELLRLELSRTLWSAANFRGGSAEIVQRLIEARADIDFQLKVSREYRALGRLLFATKSLQSRLGRVTSLSENSVHQHGSTPLMQAIRTAQWEAAATLISAGARTDLQNCKKRTVADFARMLSIPSYLQMGLDGDPSECRRVSSLALADCYLEM
ncbi:ANKK1 [Symbiodinium sp. KB8]|nr:ANKK1 [Symbiodinium sp. KB8]